MTDFVHGKSILITGAGSGFGRLTAGKCAARGASIVCADIDEAGAEATAREICETGGKAIAIRADVTKIEDMRAAVAVAVSEFGGLDVVVNNAGTMPLAFLDDHEAALESWNRCIDINFKGVMNGTVAAYDHMVEKGRGQIINLSSIYGNAPVVGSAVYGATKAAVDYFSHSVRQESRGKIKVTVIKPTGVGNTGLAAGIVNSEAIFGIIGGNRADFEEYLGRSMTGEAAPDEANPQSIEYAALAPEYIADAILHAIDQPWGVSISDMTVRASGDHYIP